jgi:aspartate-semialdehyde dehydrogenase
MSIQKKIKVGILGATGMVGQNYLKLLDNHPWFEVVALAASEKSSGKPFQEAVTNRWLMDTEIPDDCKEIVVDDVKEVRAVSEKCQMVFSCFEISDKELIKEYEELYAKEGLAVVSNASANRWTEDVPMILPEINHKHLKIIDIQRKRMGSQGFIVVKPNCSVQSYLTPVFALEQAGFEVEKMIVNTLQAVSGAGYPGVPSLSMIDNVIPYISGEEEKSEKEPQKILGSVVGEKINNRSTLNISAHCNRVPVVDGHLACVSLKFAEKKPSREEILNIWSNFSSKPQKLNLPFAPLNPITYKEEENRPQPRLDRNTDKAMTVTLGRLRECKVFDYRFVGLSHNTARGAAGGGILNAELLVAEGYVS